MVVDANTVPGFIRLLSSLVLDVREQAVWALGNIADGSPVCRDHVLQQGALTPLLALLSENHKLSMQKNATWTLSNLCRGKAPKPDWDLVRVLSPCLGDLILTWPMSPPGFPRITGLGEVDRFHG